MTMENAGKSRRASVPKLLSRGRLITTPNLISQKSQRVKTLKLACNAVALVNPWLIKLLTLLVYNLRYLDNTLINKL